MVTGYALLLGLHVDTLISARGVWGPHVAASVLLVGAALTAAADSVRTPLRTAVRTLSGCVRGRRRSRPLTCPDAIRTVSADARPDASGHIPGGGP
ncbi:hypothetical protein [Streptomyces sp. HUCO-GS316]|uniref:hypothetical protein n=1 Tax=Streptomyces sp. HUCO-GS316 TaxID=2692198 RepID=UPI00136F62BE|nr:hypothetical protein [Streptomyces sp. HUCO-GS316]